MVICAFACCHDMQFCNMSITGLMILGEILAPLLLVQHVILVLVNLYILD